MYSPHALLTLGLVLSLSALAADSPSSKLIGEIEGVYKHRFTNFEYNSSGPDIPYQTEDVVEIVRHDDTSIYVRAELHFYNGHDCSIAGIARYDGQKFIYHAKPPEYHSDEHCVLQVSADDKKLRLTDGDGSCHAYCGARGSLNNYAIDRAKKRPIRYMERLKASHEYQHAVFEASSGPADNSDAADR